LNIFSEVIDMKYRLFDGGYESFLDHRVPDEYKDIVVDKLPQEIIDAEKESMKQAEVKMQIRPLIDDVLLGSKTLAEAQAEAQAIEAASKEK